MPDRPAADVSRERDTERLYTFVREHMIGGCRILSRGNACTCPLCALDRLLSSPPSVRSVTDGEQDRNARGLVGMAGAALAQADGDPGVRNADMRVYYGLAMGCHAGRDGDCTWRDCPQLRDDEPVRSGRHCPLDVVVDDG